MTQPSFSVMRWIVLAAIVTMPAPPVLAGAIKITCAKADTIAGGGGAMTVTYDGDATGTVTIASAPVSLSIPATKTVRTGTLDGKPHSVTGITGATEGAFAMPDRAALEACASKSVQPEFKDDANMYSVALLSCSTSTPLSTAPVKASAAVSIALVPAESGGDDVVVEIKRTYTEKSPVPSGTVSIDTFPGDCTLAGE